jgi:hypothetical protein
MVKSAIGNQQFMAATHRIQTPCHLSPFRCEPNWHGCPMLAIPVACVAWTVTHGEVFREPREYGLRQIGRARTLPRRKFFYLFTCEYCFSHYVAAAFLVITRFQMLYSGWRGYAVSMFALVWKVHFLLRKRLHREKAPPANRNLQAALSPAQV